MSVRSYRKMLSVLLAVIVVIGGGYCYREWRAKKAEREASVSELSGNLLIPGGMPVGIYMETDGVMVLGTQEIKGKDGIGVNPAKHLVKEGDYIVGVDSDSIYNKSELIERVKKLSNKSVILHIRRKKCILMYNFIRQKMKAGHINLESGCVITRRDSAQSLF